MVCLVDFCRKDCPVLPEGVEVFRGSGDCLCICGKLLKNHQEFAYPSGIRHVVKGCDGKYYHL